MPSGPLRRAVLGLPAEPNRTAARRRGKSAGAAARGPAMAFAPDRARLALLADPLARPLALEMDQAQQALALLADEGDVRVRVGPLLIDVHRRSCEITHIYLWHFAIEFKQKCGEKRPTAAPHILLHHSSIPKD